MAALRKTVIGLRRWAGATPMAAACRRFAAQPGFALVLIGVALENCMTLIKRVSTYAPPSDGRGLRMPGALLSRPGYSQRLWRVCGAVVALSATVTGA